MDISIQDVKLLLGNIGLVLVQPVLPQENRIEIGEFVRTMLSQAGIEADDNPYLVRRKQWDVISERAYNATNTALENPPASVLMLAGQLEKGNFFVIANRTNTPLMTVRGQIKGEYILAITTGNKEPEQVEYTYVPWHTVVQQINRR